MTPDINCHCGELDCENCSFKLNTWHHDKVCSEIVRQAKLWTESCGIEELEALLEYLTGGSE